MFARQSWPPRNNGLRLDGFLQNIHNFLPAIDSPEAWGGAESHEEGGSWSNDFP